MPSSLPTNVSYGKVVGRFLYAAGDTTADGDVNPDGQAAVGTVTFTPNAPRVTDVSAVPPVTIFPKAVTCPIDASGYLTDPAGAAGVWLVATDDPDLNPRDWTYKVSIALQGVKTPTTFDIAVPADTTVDLAVVAPVTTSTGLTYLIGPPGPTGPTGPTGPAGAGNVTSVAGRTGVVVLTKTDVGLSNVNNTSDAAKPISDLTQDALDDKLSIVSLADLPSGSTVTVLWNGTAWPTSRPLVSAGVCVIANGGSAEPSWLITGDLWLEDTGA